MCFLLKEYLILKAYWKKIGEFGSRFIEKRNPTFYSLVGSALLALSGAYVSGYELSTEFSAVDSVAKFIAFVLTNPKLGLILGAILFIIGGISAHFRDKALANENGMLKSKVFTLETTLSSNYSAVMAAEDKIKNLLSDGRQLKEDNFKLHENMVQTWLKGLCKHIDLDCKSRVTIYYVNNNSFKLLSRNSANPLLRKFIPKEYRIDKGAISFAWQYGKHIDADIPLNDEERLEHMKVKYGYDDEELAGFKMKSLFILGLAIVDADDNVGVIAFESEGKDIFDEAKVNAVEKYCSDFQSYLCGFIRDSIRYEALAFQDSATRAKSIHDLGINADQDILQQFEVSK